MDSRVRPLSVKKSETNGLNLNFTVCSCLYIEYLKKLNSFNIKRKCKRKKREQMKMFGWF